MHRVTKITELPALTVDFLHHSGLLMGNLFASLWKRIGMKTLLSRAGFKKRSGTAIDQACRYLVIDFGTSKSPKSTRQRDNHCCPGRPASVPLRQHPRTLDAGFAALPQMTGRDFSYAYFVFPLRYRTPDKQCGPGRYRGLTAFASLSMAVSDGARSISICWSWLWYIEGRRFLCIGCR